MKIISRIAIGLASVTLLAGCTKSATTNTSTTTTPTQTESTAPSAVDTGEGRTLTVTMAEYSFAPRIIEVAAGSNNTVTIQNSGSMAHTFTIPDLNIAVEVAAGASEVVTVNAPAAGSYDVICTVVGHEALGMTGTLFVQ